MSEKKVVRRRKVRRKKKQKTIDKKIWMIIGGIIAGLVIVYLAISVFFMSHFYINTQINGKNFSGFVFVFTCDNLYQVAVFNFFDS